MKVQLVICFVLAMLVAAVSDSAALAASVAADGSHVGVNGDTRNTTTIGDTDDDYGTDGSVWFAVTDKEGFETSPPAQWSADVWDRGLLDRKPAYVSTLTPSSVLTSSGGWGYDSIDDPDDDGATQFESGGGVTNGESGSEREVISFTLGDGIPDIIRMGVYVDNNDGAANFTPASLRVAITGNSASQDMTSADIMGDLYFFAIGGANAGDVITLYSTDRPGGNTLDVVGGVTFDTAIPEPATLGMLGLSGLAAIGLSRRWRSCP